MYAKLNEGSTSHLDGSAASALRLLMEDPTTRDFLTGGADLFNQADGAGKLVPPCGGQYVQPVTVHGNVEFTTTAGSFYGAQALIGPADAGTNTIAGPWGRTTVAASDTVAPTQTLRQDLFEIGRAHV